MDTKTPVKIILNDEQIEALDDERGSIPRATMLRELALAELERRRNERRTVRQGGGEA